MSAVLLSGLREMRIGTMLALLSLIYGFSLGIYFGVFEDDIKAGLRDDAQAVFEQVYHSDQSKMDKILGKSWTYIKRAHFHATGMGTTALVLILGLALVPVERKLRSLTAFLLGFGALFYPLCWMLAGRLAPSLGSTGAAKANLSWLATPSATMSVLGVGIASFLILWPLFSKKPLKA
ncbi:MAG: hypothetical protein RRB13_00215 [bacterium]|nr:hypothetical protein [bacterium]